MKWELIMIHRSIVRKNNHCFIYRDNAARIVAMNRPTEIAEIVQINVNCWIESHCEFGKSPLWDSQSEALWWVDSQQNQLFKMDGCVGDNSNEILRSWSLDAYIYGIGLIKENRVILATNKGLMIFDALTGTKHYITETEYLSNLGIITDCSVGPDGRFWFGIMNENNVSSMIYSYHPHEGIRKQTYDKGFYTSIVWNHAQSVIYTAEKTTQTVYQYTPSTCMNQTFERSPFFRLYDAYPQGCTIDQEGCLWSCHRGAKRIVRYSPTGQPIAQINLPVSQPISCCFGGVDLDELFITTARLGLNEFGRAKEPLAGSILKVKLPVGGYPSLEMQPTPIPLSA